MVFPWFSHGFPIIFKTQPRTAAAGRIGRGTMGDMHSSIMPCQRHQGHGVTVGPRQGHTGATNIWLCLTQIMPFTWGTDGKAGKAKKKRIEFWGTSIIKQRHNIAVWAWVKISGYVRLLEHIGTT